MKVTLTPYTWRHFWPTLSHAQTLHLHESCQNKPKSKVCKMATSHSDIIRVTSSSVVFTYTHPHTNTHMLIKIINSSKTFLINPANWDTNQRTHWDNITSSVKYKYANEHKLTCVAKVYSSFYNELEILQKCSKNNRNCNKGKISNKLMGKMLSKDIYN